MRSLRSIRALVALALASEGAYYALATRYGLWAAVPDDLRFLWVYGAAVILYIVAVLTTLSARSSGRAVLAVILGFAVLFRLTLVPEPVTPYDDIYRYVWDGRVLNAGVNPYLHPPSSPQLAALAIPALEQVNSPEVVTPYPPLAEGLFAVLYWLWPGNLLAMKATFLLFDLTTIALLLALLRRFNRAPVWSIVYAWSPLPIVEFAGHGHVDAVWLPLLLGSLLLVTRGQRAWSGIGLAMATLVKVVPVLLVPVLLRRWGRRGLGAYIVAITAGVLPFVGVGPSFMGGARAMFDHWEANASLYHWAIRLNERWPLVSDIPHAFRLGAVALLLGLTLTLMLRRPGDDRSLVAACFWVFAVALAVSTTVYPWYVTWLLPLLAVLLAKGMADRCWPAYVGWWLFTCTAGIYYHAYLTGIYTRTWPEAIAILEYFPAYAGVVWAVSVLLWPRHSPGNASATPDQGTVGSNGLHVGVVIPALNEEEAIAQVLTSIPPGLAQDVVVVDGGSSDRTVALAAAAGATVIHESRRGYGRACATGAAALREVDIVVFLDGDLSDFPEEMGQLVAPIVSGCADLVVGSRLRGQRERGALPVHSLAGNWLGARLMRVIYGLRITDLGPFRAIRRELLVNLDMTEMTYGWPVEMLAKAARGGLRVTEVPVRYRRRRGRSKITGTLRGTLLASYYILSRIILYRLERAPLARPVLSREEVAN